MDSKKKLTRKETLNNTLNFTFLGLEEIKLCNNTVRKSKKPCQYSLSARSKLNKKKKKRGQCDFLILL